MKIDIKQKDEKWFVIAHLKSGLAHDVFGSLSDAIKFAKEFYGGKLVSTRKDAA